jgi:hypothetical protein
MSVTQTSSLSDVVDVAKVKPGNEACKTVSNTFRSNLTRDISFSFSDGFSFYAIVSPCTSIRSALNEALISPLRVIICVTK